MRITINQVMSWRPCDQYSIERVTELFAGRDTLTIADVFALPIPAKDRLWVLLREDCVPAPTLHEFACRVAEHALQSTGSADPRSVAAIAAKRSWVRGDISDQDLAAAWDTASVAARAAASAADSAAYCVAAMAAASAADRASDRAAAAAARDTQLVILQDLLNEDAAKED
jgi:hypothetical protein